MASSTASCIFPGCAEEAERYSYLIKSCCNEHKNINDKFRWARKVACSSHELRIFVATTMSCSYKEHRTFERPFDKFVRPIQVDKSLVRVYDKYIWFDTIISPTKKEYFYVTTYKFDPKYYELVYSLTYKPIVLELMRMRDNFVGNIPHDIVLSILLTYL